MTVIITRTAWGAREPKSRKTITTPTPELWLHHSGDNNRGAAGVRAIQAFHMDERGWADIAYSHLIDPDTLAIYEGRGPGIRGGHTYGRNSRSHGICILGNYETVRPSDALVDRVAELVAYGNQAGWWPDHLTGGHSDVRPTACPGRHIHAQIRMINSKAEALLAGDTPMPDTSSALIARWQQRLKEGGANLGDSGSNRDGVDGDFGRLTLAASEQRDDAGSARISELEIENAQLGEQLDEALGQLTEAGRDVEKAMRYDAAAALVAQMATDGSVSP